MILEIQKRTVKLGDVFIIYRNNKKIRLYKTLQNKQKPLKKWAKDIYRDFTERETSSQEPHWSCATSVIKMLTDVILHTFN